MKNRTNDYKSGVELINKGKSDFLAGFDSTLIRIVVNSYFCRKKYSAVGCQSSELGEA